MATTISVKFDATQLPEWAQRNKNVVALCKTNYEFRCEVCSVKSEAMKRLCIRTANTAAGDY